jgi:hypothetical protein
VIAGISAEALNQAIKRNSKRFPLDFMFQLNPRETGILRSQIVTSKPGRGGRRFRPYAFTEHGGAMLAGVLRSDRAIRVNIAIVRSFVRLREFLSTHQDLAKRLAKMEKNYDAQFQAVFEAIRHLMGPLETKKNRRLGFVKEG